MGDWQSVSIDGLAELPDVAGVYRFRDAQGRILYIGKSVHLRTRVRSYLRRDGGHSRQTERLKFEARTVEVLPTGSELAALLLEGRLIRQVLPPFNQAQKRFRHYPFLKLTLQETYPRLQLTRVLAADGAEYYGPYSQPHFVRTIAELLSTNLMLRDCRDLSAIHHGCLLDQLGKCLAPCRSESVKPEYQQRVEQLRALLRGEQRETLLNRFEAQMHQAAEREDFELAARWRDRWQSLRGFLTQQGYLRERIRLDAVAVQPGPPDQGRSVQVFWIRRGKVVAEQSIPAAWKPKQIKTTIEETFKTHFLGLYEESTFVLPQQDLDEVQIIGDWLYRHRQDADLLWLTEVEPEQVVTVVFELIAQQRLQR